ncbi:hypothetical protein PIROE2DRAFT_58708 [Piromyces sp. E2]|nr:hypothetical protein PIROE2DRAFT_58708 [Piromyces sp. E2]|eukprot:OUM67576.1 hypothetical protein PIROE2DRAFT_58708 [Piromyces sp. E2]
MFCSITKEPVQDPVISKKTGHLYEKRIIQKYLEENHKCPITGEEMTEDDLIELKTGTSTLAGKPRPPTATSIPSLLTLFQNEWDSVMLETYQLKQQYQKVRQELSHALYQHDAACRVIARLTKERNEAREALINLQQTLNAQAPAEDTEMTDASNGIGMTPEIIENMSNTSNALSKVRRKRKPGPEVATHDEVKSFSSKIEIPSLHSTNPSGILSVDLLTDTVKDKKVTWALTGGKDGHVNIIDYENDGKIVQTEKAHSKKINQVTWYTKQDKMPGAFFTASADKTVKLWSCDVDSDDKTISNQYAFKGHSAEITSLSIHATGDYFASASVDSTWSLVDLATNQLIVKVAKDEIDTVYLIKQWTELCHLSSNGDNITSMCWGPNSKSLASVGMDRSLRFYGI